MWIKMDPDSQKAVDAIICEARADLLAAGFPARGSRFPYAMHHGHYRAKVRINRAKMTHAQIAYLLNRWTAERGDPSDYARQALCGAVGAMLAKSPAHSSRLPNSVSAAMSKVEQGADFLRWAAANCEALVGDIVDVHVPEEPAEAEQMAEAA